MSSSHIKRPPVPALGLTYKTPRPLQSVATLRMSCDQRRVARGFNAQDLAATLDALQMPSIEEEERNSRRLKWVTKRFDEYIAATSTQTVNVPIFLSLDERKIRQPDAPPIATVAISTFTQILDQRLGFPPVGVIQAVLTYFAVKRPGRAGPGTKLTAASVETFFNSICTTYRRIAKHPVFPSDIKAGTDMCAMLAQKLSLPMYPTTRAQLTADSIFALANGVFDDGLRWSSIARFSIGAFIAVDAQSAARSGSFLRLRSLKKTLNEIAGLKIGGVEIYLLPPNEGGKVNRAMGYLKPSTGKTVTTTGKPIGFGIGPTIGTSTCDMILLAFWAQGHLTVDDLASLYDPETVRDGKPRCLCLPDDVLALPVFPKSRSQRETSLTTQLMNKKLKSLSIRAGLKTIVTTLAFRHCGSQHLDLEGVDEEGIRDALLQRPKSTATGSYLGRGMTVQAKSVLQGVAPNIVRLTTMAMRSNAQPDLLAPRHVTQAQVDDLLSGTTQADVRFSNRVTAASRALSTSKRRLEEAENLGDKENAAVLKKAKVHHAHAVEQARVVTLDVMRDQYFSNKALGRPADAQQQATTVADTAPKWDRYAAIRTCLASGREAIPELLAKLRIFHERRGDSQARHDRAERLANQDQDDWIDSDEEEEEEQEEDEETTDEDEMEWSASESGDVDMDIDGDVEMDA